MMLARQILGDDRAGLRELYESIRFLVDRAVLQGTEQTERRLTVVPEAGDEGWFEVRARVDGHPVFGDGFWVPLVRMDELAFTYDAFAEAVPVSLEEALDQMTAKPKTS